ncbi:hypothetical protein D5S17_34690 [Pseudonocardiaceae bacterium YIM PH 21723]|nr:hypothetical protein D5S17_34690 [Pseudonocardiaceae bacterium YIM PH 21723]
MTTWSYPHLGFDPVPGTPESVDDLGAKIKKAVDSMTEANSLMGRLRNAGDSVWQGEAGDKFREKFNGDLAKELENANKSLNKAVDVVKGWGGNLIDFKQNAKRLDEEAGLIKEGLEKARQAYETARKNPDLGLAGKHFDTDAALQQAQRALNAAQDGIRTAGAKVEDFQGQLDSVMKRAKELGEEHTKVAKRAAEELKAATEKLAPSEPGMFSKMWDSFTGALKDVGDWIGDHLDDIHSVLSSISAVAGLIALVTPPPIDAIALGVSVVAGAGALAVNLANPETRAAIGGLLHGDFSKDNLMKAASVGLDGLTLLPGIGAAKGAIKGVEGAAEGMAAGMPKLVQAASEVAHQPGLVSKGIAKIPGVGKVVTAVTEVAPVRGAVQTMHDVATAGRAVATDAAGVATQAAQATQRGVEFLWKTRGAVTGIINAKGEVTS